MIMSEAVLFNAIHAMQAMKLSYRLADEKWALRLTYQVVRARKNPLELRMLVLVGALKLCYTPGKKGGECRYAKQRKA